ncbi:MAG TPA: long-chain fatty acid--CoA ligase [Candidatus Omnitrophota bacterium]|nr:long-chain fatty acid--CoA ligase [Candidatus Omnitrophota bacterium]HRZ14815.1 long-chain fatty acid--CoA ligase [Candidatus Omnitrophota bacterium]
MNPHNLGELLTASAKRFPQRTAIIFGRKKITYKTLDETTDQIAAGLVRMGISKGDTVAVLLDNCPEFVISYYAIAKAGGIIVPINYMFKMDEARYILENSEAEFLITSRLNLEMAEELLMRVESLKHIITTTRIKDRMPDLQRIKRARVDVLEKVAPSWDDIAVLLYTSGTTGHPKGAMLTHYNLIANTVDCSQALRILPRDTFICILPLFHSFAATVCMNLPLFIGARIVIMKSLKPFKRVVRAIRNNRVSIFVGIPSIYTVFKNIKLPRIFHSPLIKLFNPVKLCVSGAAALPVETLQGFEKKFRIPLIEGYGLTEASPVVTLNPVNGTRKPGSIGKRLSGRIDLRIVDEKGRDVETGKIGELLVRGPNVMRGYYQQLDANRETLKNGWLYTGDMARFDKDGYVYIAGRKKEMINVRGLNVYPREIEEVLYRHPKVKEAAVIGIADEHKGEVPKGFVVLKEGEQVASHELTHFLREHLAAYKIPKLIEVRDILPKNSTGKILKRMLQDEERNQESNSK